MGCDIHMVVQVKKPEYNHWFTQGKFRGDRWYTLFAYMNTDVRNYDKVDGLEARYLPTDSWYKEHDEETATDLGDHSFSFMSAPEFETAIRRAAKHDKCTDVQDYLAILMFMYYFNAYGYDTRLVFGFDS